MKRRRSKEAVQAYRDMKGTPKPHQYREDFVRQVFYLSLLGATDKQMVEILGCSVSAFEHWKRTKPDFLESMQRGKAIADAHVAHSLFQSAIGYSHPDSVVLTNRVRKRNDEGKVIEEYTEPLIVETVKHYPPNVTAAIKWLSVRQPDKWAEKSRLEVSGNVTVSHQLDFSDFTEQELQTLNKLGIKQIVEDIPYEEE